ncbi:hypothetical protein Barb6_03439 [Bacteroidales bacterium Barb6]|nr:hypothetical protein Barb6_03439 [Bacteroidales bacterium Barb6]
MASISGCGMLINRPNSVGFPKIMYSTPGRYLSVMYCKPLNHTKSITPVPSENFATRRLLRPSPTVSN